MSAPTGKHIPKYRIEITAFFLISLPPKVFHITSLFQILQYLPTAPWNNLILYNDLQSTIWSGPCLLLRSYLCDIPITHSAQHTAPPPFLFPKHAELFLDSGSWYWLFLLHKMFSSRSFNVWVLLTIQVSAQILLSQGVFSLHSLYSNCPPYCRSLCPVKWSCSFVLFSFLSPHCINFHMVKSLLIYVDLCISSF